MLTLRDAGDYITSLPKTEQDLEEWQAAVEALLLVVELSGPTMMARIGILRALNRNVERTLGSSRQRHALGKAEAQEGPMTTVWIYVDTRCHPGHPAHLKVFANPVAADEWFKEKDPEGVAFEYEVLE